MADTLKGRAWGKTVETTIQNPQDLEISEQRLWRAVIASTIEEWIHGPLSKKREAEQFLFHDAKDYRTVCYSAGINPDSLRDRLQKIRSRHCGEEPALVTRN